MPSNLYRNQNEEGQCTNVLIRVKYIMTVMGLENLSLPSSNMHETTLFPNSFPQNALARLLLGLVCADLFCSYPIAWIVGFVYN